jgi:hypothetical protein
VWMIVQDVVKPCIYWELNARAANQTPFLKHLKAVVHPHTICTSTNQYHNPRASI